MSLPVMRTERLRLDPLADAHAEHLVALDADPDVMRYVGKPLVRDEALAELQELLAVREPFGFWAGFEATTFAGVWCVTPDRADETVGELSYRLPTRAWGRGLAGEGAAAVLGHAFGAAGLALVWSGTRPGNLASRRVLTKLGFVPSARPSEDEVPFEIDAHAWAG